MVDKGRKRIAVLGSTGSVGTQTLDVIKNLPDDLELVAIAAGSNTGVLNRQITDLKPRYVGLTNKLAASGLESGEVEVFLGEEALTEIATLPEVDIVVIATSGTVALPATVEALRVGKIVALANKETLVIAGEIIMPLVRFRDQLRTIDSEHSAIWQCLLGEDRSKIKNVVLTASGGAFRDYTFEQLQHSNSADALKHPSWNMGKQVTVDSATLMNKCFEIMEAHWLFGMPYDKIKVLIHKQSIVHSLVEFVDGSIKAQLAIPDMHLVIQFALTFPERVGGGEESIFLDWTNMEPLTFELPDLRRFPCLDLGYEVGRLGKTYPAVLVAANEVVVGAFLKRQIGYVDVPVILNRLVEKHSGLPVTPGTIHETMDWARREALRLCRTLSPPKRRSRFLNSSIALSSCSGVKSGKRMSVK